MCFNIVQYYEYECGDCSVVRRQTVDCNNKYCKFSCMHETQSHDCESLCKQAMLPDQGIITDKRSAACSCCAGRTNGYH